MSIESRLTALQTKVEEILTVARNGNGHGSGGGGGAGGGRRLFTNNDDPWSVDTITSPPGASRVDYNNPLSVHHHHLSQQQQHPHQQQQQSHQQNFQHEGEPESVVLLSPQAEIRTLELWRAVVAECLGTLCFVFFVCGVSIPWTGHYPPFLSVAFATALAYGALTYKVFPRAHLNPAFTLPLTAIKRLTPLRCLLFITAQAGGAIAGAALLFGLTVPGYQGSLGATTIATHINPIQAFGLEFILSFVLVLTFVSDPNNCFPTTAILLAANLVALPCTGAGLNPIRSLGPAFVMNKWPSHWVFWLGPILGGLMAAYLNCYILRRKKSKKVREHPTDGDSMDIPATDLPTTIPDRLLCDRFEPLYGGTRSLYMKPSPVLPRSNLHRSQSVYASKRFDFPPKFFDASAPSSATGTNRKTTNALLQQSHHQQQPPPSSNSNSGGGGGGGNNGNHCHRHFESESNYEPLYDRKPPAGGAAQSLLMSGPPSYESNYFKTFDKLNHSASAHHQQHSGSGNHHHHHHHHNRDKSDSTTASSQLQQQRERERENQTNRILAQYETAKGLVDVDPKAALKSQLSKSLYSHYDTNEHNNTNSSSSTSTNNRKHHQHHQQQQHLDSLDKKLLDANTSTSSSSGVGGQSLSDNSNNDNPPPPPKFRLHAANLTSSQSSSHSSTVSQQQQQHRNPPAGQCKSDTPPPLQLPPGFGPNDLSRVIVNGNGGGPPPKGGWAVPNSEAKKPYELLESKKLLEFNSNGNGGGPPNSNSNNYSPRLLMAERDLTYSRILEPILNSKPGSHLVVLDQQQQQQSMNTNHHNHNGIACRMSPNDHLTYSYH